MERDFTLKLYGQLLRAIKGAGYKTLSYEMFIKDQGQEKVYILRHDVDALPENSLKTAIAEAELGMKGTYYFRIVKQSNRPDIIRKITALGHEIGYHYEDLALCHGNYERAYERFKINLEHFRKFYPVTTVCMHGSPLSKWDNRLLWNKYSYKQHGVLAEPYFDTDFNKVQYITDTGRSWNAKSASVRDKVNSSINIPIHSTFHLIEMLQQGEMKTRVMQNIHPQRWHSNSLMWIKELLFQNSKNVVKSFLSREAKNYYENPSRGSVQL